MQNNIRILGIDPGYDRCGISVIEKSGNKNIFLSSDCIETSRKDTYHVRLFTVGKIFLEWCNKYSPNQIAIETIFFEKNQKTAMKIAEVRGMITYIAQTLSIPVFEFTPLQIKVAVAGHGGGTKDNVMRMIPKLIDIPEKKRKDDEYDAIAVALTSSAITRL